MTTCCTRPTQEHLERPARRLPARARCAAPEKRTVGSTISDAMADGRACPQAPRYEPGRVRPHQVVPRPTREVLRGYPGQLRGLAPRGPVSLPVPARMAAQSGSRRLCAGGQAVARIRTEELARFAGATSQTLGARCGGDSDALTAGHGDGEIRFRESLGHDDRADRPMDAARTQLAYGRSGCGGAAKRRMNARQRQRVTVETFHDLRAADRAARSQPRAAHRENRTQA